MAALIHAAVHNKFIHEPFMMENSKSTINHFPPIGGIDPFHTRLDFFSSNAQENCASYKEEERGGLRALNTKSYRIEGLVTRPGNTLKIVCISIYEQDQTT